SLQLQRVPMRTFRAPSQASGFDRLLDAAREGDQRAAGRLLDESRPLLSSYFRKRTRSADDCEDLVQNVLVRATRNLASFRNDCPLSQWLLRIAANELANYYERNLGRSACRQDDFDLDSVSSSMNEEGTTESDSDAGVKESALKLLAVAQSVCRSEEFA